MEEVGDKDKATICLERGMRMPALQDNKGLTEPLKSGIKRDVSTLSIIRLQVSVDDLFELRTPSNDRSNVLFNRSQLSSTVVGYLRDGSLKATACKVRIGATLSW